MSDCIPLFVPSNLGETKLYIGISSTFCGIGTRSSIWENYVGTDEACHLDCYSCSMFVPNVKLAQQKVIDLSRKLEQEFTYPIQSDRIFFLPLFANVSYGISVTPKRHCERPVVRVLHCPDKPEQPWKVKIIASNLVQLQKALFSHEQNLLRKQMQVLKEQNQEVHPNERTASL